MVKRKEDIKGRRTEGEKLRKNERWMTNKRWKKFGVGRSKYQELVIMRS